MAGEHTRRIREAATVAWLRVQRERPMTFRGPEDERHCRLLFEMGFIAGAIQESRALLRELEGEK